MSSTTSSTITYPLTTRNLQQLTKGPKAPKANVFIEDSGDKQLIFGVPKTVLAYFSPVLQKTLQDNQVILLKGCGRKVANWALNWMCAGGETVSKEPVSFDDLLQRTQLMIQLEIPGPLVESLLAEIKAVLQRSTGLSSDAVNWLYGQPAETQAPRLREEFVAGVMNSILKGNLVMSYKCNNPLHMPAFALFRKDLIKAVAAPEFLHQIRNIQKRHPLTIPQLRFLYIFTPPTERTTASIRKSVAKDFLELLDNGKVPNNADYHKFAWENKNFEIDMANAIDTKGRYLAFLEREARRKARAAEGKPTQQQGRGGAQGRGKPQGRGQAGKKA